MGRICRTPQGYTLWPMRSNVVVEFVGARFVGARFVAVRLLSGAAGNHNGAARRRVAFGR